MNLNKLFSTANPSVVAFINKLEIRALGEGKPIFPQIIGTGFLIHPDGIAVTNRHVIDWFAKFPAHPKTNESAIGAVLFMPGDTTNLWQMLVLPVLEWQSISEFESSDRWFGEETPDIGFVQVGAREVSHLKLATEEFYLQIGMSIATIGYPMGRLPLTVMGTLHQASPFIRHGIVSSVFPFPTALPHGFTIDIMQQGGSSGSPILETENATVVGMMKSSVQDVDQALGHTVQLVVAHNTNISIAEPAHIIHKALESFLERKRDISKLETLAEIKAKHPPDLSNADLEWDSWTERVK